MKDILIHYGVKGMKWGVRKEYEATGGGGGGGWGPSIATGGGPSPLAASMAGNPKKRRPSAKPKFRRWALRIRRKLILDANEQRAIWSTLCLNTTRV